MKKPLIAVVLSCLVLVGGCAAPGNQGPSAEHGFGSALRGIAHIMLSPVQIAAGLVEGLASLPYFLSGSVHELNRGLVDAQAAITLDDTYESAYGKRIAEVAPDGDTGEVFRRMKHASRYFQKVLDDYGVRDAEHYILTSIDTANDQGYTLFAVVYRPQEAITVVDKYDHRSIRSFDQEDRLFYEPFATDLQQRPLDTVIDWVGMPRSLAQTQKAQAIMLTLAANSVIANKRSPDYWAAERDWIDGQFMRITEQKMAGVKEKLSI